MDDAWQNQDIAPNSNNGVPNGSNPPPGSAPDGQGSGGHPDNVGGSGAPMNTDEPGWNGGGRRSRSRSPGRKDDRDRDRGDRGDRDRGDRGDRGERGGRDDRRGGAGGGVNPGNNLHVSGLHTKVDSRDLEAAFAKAGRVQKASIMLDPHSRESRGFGFVTMESPEEAEAAIVMLNSSELMGKTMNVEKARRGRARTPTPGRYYGPPKRRENERPYDPRPYDSRYDDYYRRRDPRDEPRRDEYRRDDRERHGGGGGRGYGGGRDRYDDAPRRDERRYDDRPRY